MVWIRCHGIPVHAWNDDFFASLARKFGEYLGVDEVTRSKSVMDVARIMLRTKGYDVFNAVVTANINGSLFHIKMVEKWCGPIQWIEFGKVDNVVNYSSGSDDGGEDGPPLFTAEGGWEDDEFLEEVEETMCGDEDETEYEVESNVQETVDVPNEHEPNDCTGGIVQPLPSPIVENDENNDGGIRINVEGSEEVEDGTCNSPHISNSLLDGGVHKESNSDMGERNENCETGGRSNKGGCEKKTRPKKSNKAKKRSGLVKHKKRGRKGKSKNKKEFEFHFEATPEDDQNKETKVVSSFASSQSWLMATGVVRNLHNQFQPSVSLSINAIGASSQVESVGDSGIMMGNNRYEKEMEKAQAERLWSLAKEKLGVTVEGDDELYIEKIREMEERDNLVKVTKGKMQSSK